MMTSLAQAYSPHGGIQQHPGVPPGHPMAGPHNPGQPGMPQQMHMAVSGPGGPQVSQAGGMMGGMPPGAGGPSAHALQHLNPNAAQAQQALIQQQQAMAFQQQNPQYMQQQQQHILRQQQARQMMMQQHYSGGMPTQNGMQISQAQYQAMQRANPGMARPVNLPQHLQQAQAQAQHTLQQQQEVAAQQHQHQQQLIAQQIALQHQATQAQGGGNPGQPNQMQQMHNLQQAQMAQHQQAQQQAQAQAQQQAQQQQQQQQQSAAASQQNLPAQSQPQPQPQSQPNPQGQPPQVQQVQPPNPVLQQQQQAAMMAARQQQAQAQHNGEKFRGQSVMKLMSFANKLSGFGTASKSLQSYIGAGAEKLAAQGMKQRDDLKYWSEFVGKFFSPRGVLRHTLWDADLNTNKQFEITFPALARYFHTHFESGIQTMQLIMEEGAERDLPNGGFFVDCPRSSLVYWFDNSSQLVASGSLRAHFDSDRLIELLEFITSSHEEYLPRSRIIEAARPLHEWGKEWHKVNAPQEGKQSPELNKKKPKPMKSPPQAPPEIDIPDSKVKKSMGITPNVFRFLELAEVMGQMNPLFGYAHQHSSLAPYAALDQYVHQVANNVPNNPGQQQNPSGPRTPGMSNFPMGASPAAAHLQLPDGSPHIGGSPAQAPGMQLQQSQHGTSSSGPSANTSPNTSNKRRRPSTVKTEDEAQANGTQSKTAVRPSPRITKRQKPNGP